MRKSKLWKNPYVKDLAELEAKEFGYESYAAFEAEILSRLANKDDVISLSAADLIGLLR